MKKLISAASALAMAASMVGAAVPFATGAADATKGFELKVFANKDGSMPSTKISADAIAAGDVTIPVGIYYKEGTADSSSITSQWTVSSSSADPSAVKFTKKYEGNDKYFSTAQTQEGFETDKLAAFAGEIKDSRGVKFSGAGTYTCTIDDKQNTVGCDYAWGSIVWIKPSQGGYKWTGSTSDAYPCYVFDVTFAKNAKAGKYTLEFLDKVTDPAYPDVYTSMVEGAAKYIPTPKNGENTLTLTNLEFEIGGTGSTTTPDPTDPPVVTPDPTNPPTPTNPSNPNPGTNPGSGDVLQGVADFVITGQLYEKSAKPAPGETIDVDFILTKCGDYKSATFAADPTPGYDADIADETCYCMEKGEPQWSKMGESFYNYCQDKDTQDALGMVEDQLVISVSYTIPKDIKDGTYSVGFTRFEVVEDTGVREGHEKKVFNATVVPYTFTIGTPSVNPDPTEPPVQPTTVPVTPTTQPTVQPTTTPAPVGDVKYGDTNCDGTVNIADVVVLNKWLNDNTSYPITDQGKANADCCDAKGGAGLDANDSDAIIKSIVHLVTLPTTADKLG